MFIFVQVIAAVHSSMSNVFTVVSRVEAVKATDLAIIL
jgi:hypothetical protein